MGRPKRPVRALVLTSIRDVGVCDLNGCTVPTACGPRYMEGIIERSVKESRPGGALDGLLEIAGIVTDDLPKNLEGSTYPLVPTTGKQWVHPCDLEDRHGNCVAKLTTHIPSEFRRIPNRDADVKREAKRAFEMQVLEHMKAVGADIIVSDHYMAKIEYLIGEFGLYGRVLNVHPAVTDKRHECCFRGPTPTADAIAKAKTGAHTQTGATLHLINEEFDDGLVIESVWPTPVFPTDTPQELRWRNYQMAKLPVFTRGMQYYVTEMFGNL